MNELRHLVDPLDLSFEETLRLLDLADSIANDRTAFAHKCEGKILATLFYEPSTRTRLSFESAMMRLGGKVLGFASAQNSSASKGESVADTVRMVSCYSDIIAMRHNKEGAPRVAAQYARVPVINAGDGEKGRLNNLTIGLCGDLKFGRTVHSLIKSLVRWEGIRFVFISPEELHVPSYIIDEVVKPSGCEYKEVRTMDEVLPELDVLYMTRVQRERFFNEEDYICLKDSFILDAEKMKLAPKDLIVLHPLPRINEIAVEVDDDPRAKYFVQAQNSVYVRMALILMLLNIEPGLFEEETVC